MSRLAACALLLAFVFPATRARAEVVSAELRQSLRLLSADSLRVHAGFLGDDACQGRGTGTPGGVRAAHYIAAQLRAIGLEPMGEDSTFFQPIPLHGSVPLPQSRFQVGSPDSLTELALDRDYLLYKTGAKTFIPQPLPLVFAGYGIVAPEYDYNDYQGIDIEGAIVVFLAGEPISHDSTYFAGDQSTLYSLPEMKQRLAIARGARGSIMIPQPRAGDGKTWDDWRREFAFEHVTPMYEVSGNLSVLLNPECAPLFFARSPRSLDDVYWMDQSGTLESFPLNSAARFTGRFREREFIDYNVLGLLPGSDPLLRSSCVILCAHYDHLGIGPAVRADSMYNGVVDNALGVSAVLEIARALSTAPVRFRRSILFLLVTGEEKGLLGSQHYGSHPAVPLHRTIAAVNVDGLAIIDTFDDVTGIGVEFSTMGDHLEQVVAELGLSVSPAPPLFRTFDAFACSDQLAFAQAGVPSALVIEGFAYRRIPSAEGMRRFIEWGALYHSPFDDLHQSIDYQAALQHCQVIAAFTGALADTHEPPQWIGGSQYMNARLQSLAEER